jgi:hypothetical protein
MENSVPIATIDFNVDEASGEEIHEVLEKIRETEGLIAFEQGHNELYTVARKE